MNNHYYIADVTKHNDYSPFGMQMPGRKSNEEGYRYAFNGMETDKEVSGGGNSYTTQFRQYDPRLGRWKSLDPLAGKFPGMSPFVAFNNNPIVYTDPLGLEAVDPQSDRAPKEKGGDKVVVVENEHGTWVWNPKTQTWTGSTKTVEHNAGTSSNNNGVKPEPTAIDNTKVVINKNSQSGNSSDSGYEPSLLDKWDATFARWFRSIQGSATASVGIEFESKDNRSNPNSIPPMKLDINGWSIKIDIDGFDELVDILSLTYPAIPAPKLIKPKYTRAQYRNKKYIEYDKKKMYRGLGTKTMAAKRNAADAAYDKYLKNIANQNKANLEKWINETVKEELSPMPDAEDIARMIRDGGTGTQDGGYGKTGAQQPVIVIQHSSGSYMYSNGIWFHRMACTSCPTEYNDEGKAYKDSTYQKINESDVPKSILKKVK